MVYEYRMQCFLLLCLCGAQYQVFYILKLMVTTWHNEQTSGYESMHLDYHVMNELLSSVLYSQGAQCMLLPLACASHVLQGLLLRHFCRLSVCECRKDGDVYRSLLEVAQRSPFNDTEEGPAWKPVLEARLNPNVRANAKL